MNGYRATTALGRKQQFVSILLSADGNHIFRLQSNIRHQEHWMQTRVMGAAHVPWLGPVLAAWPR